MTAHDVDGALRAARVAFDWSDATRRAGETPASVSWLLEPIAGRANITWPQRADDGAAVQINLVFARLALALAPEHTTALLALSSLVVAHQRRHAHAFLRPLSMRTAAARWRYVLDCALTRVRERDGTLGRTWAQLHAFCKKVCVVCSCCIADCVHSVASICNCGERI